MPTKLELEKTNKQLKAKVKELMKKLEETIVVKKDEDENLTEPAVSIIKVGKKYQLVELRFNPETKQAKVIEIRDAHKLTDDFGMAEFAISQFVIEKIMNRF